MKEKCEKLFHIYELINAIVLILYLLISSAILVLFTVFLIAQHKYVFILPVAAFVLFGDAINIIGFKIFKKSAFYAERNGDSIDFYVVGKTVSKKISDCVKIGNSAYYRTVFTFNDNEKIRLRKFPGCPEATDWISKKDFPNVK